MSLLEVCVCIAVGTIMYKLQKFSLIYSYKTLPGRTVSTLAHWTPTQLSTPGNWNLNPSALNFIAQELNIKDTSLSYNAMSLKFSARALQRCHWNAPFPTEPCQWLSMKNHWKPLDYNDLALILQWCRPLSSSWVSSHSVVVQRSWSSAECLVDCYDSADQQSVYKCSGDSSPRNQW